MREASMYAFCHSLSHLGKQGWKNKADECMTKDFSVAKLTGEITQTEQRRVTREGALITGGTYFLGKFSKDKLIVIPLILHVFSC